MAQLITLEEFAEELELEATLAERFSLGGAGAAFGIDQFPGDVPQSAGFFGARSIREPQHPGPEEITDVNFESADLFGPSDELEEPPDFAGDDSDGLIDIRSLASSLPMAEKEADDDGLLNIGGGGFAPSLGAPVLAASRPGMSKGILFAIIGGSALLGALLVLAVVYYWKPQFLTVLWVVAALGALGALVFVTRLIYTKVVESRRTAFVRPAPAAQVVVKPSDESAVIEPVGLTELRRIESRLADRMAQIGKWERALDDEDDHGQLTLLQCLRCDELLKTLFLEGSEHLGDAVSSQIDNPIQRRIVTSYYERRNKATLGLLQLWLIGFRRALINGDPVVADWMGRRFSVPEPQPDTTTGDLAAILGRKELIHFVDRVRTNYRNPLAHSDPPVIDGGMYRGWCADAYATESLSKWLSAGWRREFGWIAALVACAARARRL